MAKKTTSKISEEEIVSSAPVEEATPPEPTVSEESTEEALIEESPVEPEKITPEEVKEEAPPKEEPKPTIAPEPIKEPEAPEGYIAKGGIPVEIKVLNPKAKVPAYSTKGSAGFDLVALEGFTFKPGQRHLFKLGLAMAIPEGYELQIRPRSGLAAKKGFTVTNSPGTIDSDYRGELMVSILNTNQKYNPNEHRIMSGDRIAQGVLCKVPQATFTVVEDLSKTDRGEGGFGSTGK